MKPVNLKALRIWTFKGTVRKWHKYFQGINLLFLEIICWFCKLFQDTWNCNKNVEIIAILPAQPSLLLLTPQLNLLVSSQLKPHCPAIPPIPLSSIHMMLLPWYCTSYTGILSIDFPLHNAAVTCRPSENSTVTQRGLGLWDLLGSGLSSLSTSNWISGLEILCVRSFIVI